MKFPLVLFLLLSFACISYKEKIPEQKAERTSPKEIVGLKVISKSDYRTEKDFWDVVDAWKEIIKKMYPDCRIKLVEIKADMSHWQEITGIEIWYFIKKEEEWIYFLLKKEK